MQKILFIVVLFLVVQSFVESAELEKIAEIESSESWFWHLSLSIDSDNAYLCGCISVDDEYYHKGMIAQINCETESVVWEKKIEDADKTIIPRIIKVTDDDEVELISELSLFRASIAYGNQVVNLRKYSKNGDEISNYTDSSNYLKAMKANFPIRYNKVTEGISVYYTPMSHHTQAYSYAVHLDDTGKYLSSSLIDSSNVTNQDTLNRYLVKGFENYSSGVYAYGVKHIKKEPSEVLAGYILKLDTDDEYVWKKAISPNNGYFTIHDICVTPEDEIIVLGFKGDGTSTVYKLDSDGEIKWDVPLGTDQYKANAVKVIQNLSGDFILVGSAVNNTSNAKSDRYMAKIDKDGKILWQKKEGIQFNEYLTDVVEYEPNKYYVSSVRTTLAQLFKFEDTDVSVNENMDAADLKIKEYNSYYEIENNQKYDKAEIVSIRGKVLNSFSISDKSFFYLQKDDYYKGVYFLRLTGKNSYVVKKLMY